MEDLLDKPIQIEFTEKKNTSDAGLIFAHAVIKKLDLSRRVSDQIPDPREPFLIVHQQSEQIHQRILQVVAGYADINDAQTLRTDPAFTTLVLAEHSQQHPLSSPSTLCRLENRFDRAGIEKLATLQVDLYLQRNENRFQEEFNSTGRP